MQLLENNNIIPIYVPAGCTDVMQECDTVINAPFKKYIKACFRDQLHTEFEYYKRTCDRENRAYLDWTPDLKMSALKPLITGWVKIAMNHLNGAEMKPSIINAFKKDGCMTEIRSQRRRLAYLRNAVDELQQIMDEIMRGQEEENVHEIALAGDPNELVDENDDIEVVNDDDVASNDDDNDD